LHINQIFLAIHNTEGSKLFVLSTSKKPPTWC